METFPTWSPQVFLSHPALTIFFFAENILTSWQKILIAPRRDQKTIHTSPGSLMRISRRRMMHSSERRALKSELCGSHAEVDRRCARPMRIAQDYRRREMADHRRAAEDVDIGDALAREHPSGERSSHIDRARPFRDAAPEPDRLGDAAQQSPAPRSRTAIIGAAAPHDQKPDRSRHEPHQPSCRTGSLPGQAADRLSFASCPCPLGCGPD